MPPLLARVGLAHVCVHAFPKYLNSKQRLELAVRRTVLSGPKGEVADARDLAQSPHGLLQSRILQRHPQSLLVLLVLHLQNSRVLADAFL